MSPTWAAREATTLELSDLASDDAGRRLRGDCTASSDGTAASSTASSAVVASERRSAWPQSAAIITGEVMGTGVLSLPYACAHLGWALGLSASLGFAVAATYSGWLLSECKNSFFPQAESYADLAHATGGPRFGRATRAAILLGWALLLPYYLIAAVDAVRVAFPTLCFYEGALAAAAAIVLPLQLRSFHLLSYLSALSTFSVVVVVLLMVVTILGDGAAPAEPLTSIAPPAATGFLDFYGHLAAFIFAYQGQSVFLEIMREMRHPDHFPRALVSANGLMATVYTGVTTLAYAKYGRSVASFLPEALPEGRSRTAIGLLLAFHTVVSYLLTGQPLHRAMHMRLWPHTAREGANESEARAHWAIVTIGYLVVCYAVANVVPYFADVQALIGALSGTPIVFGWPAYFYLRAHALRRLQPDRLHLMLCRGFLFICLPVFWLLGTLNALRAIGDDWGRATAPPFSCEARG